MLKSLLYSQPHLVCHLQRIRLVVVSLLFVCSFVLCFSFLLVVNVVRSHQLISIISQILKILKISWFFFLFYLLPSSMCPKIQGLSYAKYTAPNPTDTITRMKATMIVPNTPTNSNGSPAFWFGLQTDKGDGALVQPPRLLHPGKCGWRFSQPLLSTLHMIPLVPPCP